MGSRTADRNLRGIVAINATEPFIDSREISGRPNQTRVYGTAIENGRLVTIRTPSAIFGTKAQAAPIIWWNGREVVENGVPANDFALVNAGDMVGAEWDGLKTTVFKTPHPARPDTRFSSETRLPGQAFSVALTGGYYFGNPRAQAPITPFTGAYMSWRQKSAADHQHRTSMRYVTKTGNIQTGEGYKIIDYQGVERAAPGGKLYQTYRDPGGFIQTSYFPTGVPIGPMKIVGLVSGAELVFLTPTHYPYLEISGTPPAVGDTFTFTDNDAVVHDGGAATITAVDTVNKTFQISAKPESLLITKVGGYVNRVTSKVSGGYFQFGAFLENSNASKLFRYSTSSTDTSGAVTSIGSNSRFFMNRKGPTFPEKRYYENAVNGGDLGYGLANWATGNWEFVEVVHQFQDSKGDGLGYGYGSISGARKYSNFVDLPGLDFTRANELYCIGHDGTGGGDTIGDEVWVNELYYDVTCQRVYLSNSATYKASGKNIELQLPIRWKPDEVSFHLNLGGLNTALPLYLYVADEKNFINGQDVNSYNNASDVNGIPVELF